MKKIKILNLKKYIVLGAISLAFANCGDGSSTSKSVDADSVTNPDSAAVKVAKAMSAETARQKKRSVDESYVTYVLGEPERRMNKINAGKAALAKILAENPNLKNNVSEIILRTGDIDLWKDNYYDRAVDELKDIERLLGPIEKEEASLTAQFKKIQDEYSQLNQQLMDNRKQMLAIGLDINGDVSGSSSVALSSETLATARAQSIEKDKFLNKALDENEAAYDKTDDLLSRVKSAVATAHVRRYVLLGN